MPLSAALAEETIEIRVVRQDTVIGICNAYLEEPQRWGEIAAFNRLKDPDRIYPGDIIQIPVSYLKGLPTGGVVRFATGQVERLAAGAQSWQAVRQDDVLAEGDRIRTGADGEAEIAMPDAIALRMRPETELTISTARRKGLGSTLWRLYQQAGRSITKVHQLTGKQREVDIQTPSALAGVRGTQFRLSVDGAQTTRCEVLEGNTRLEAQRRHVEVPAGQGTLIAPGAAPQAPRALLQPPRLTETVEIYRRLPLVLTVASDAGAKALSYQLAADEALQRILEERQIPAGEPIRIEKLEDGHYFLSLAARDEAGLTGMPSASLPLAVRIHPLPPFVSQPAAEQVFYTTRPEFTWLRVSDAQCYRIQIARDRQFQDRVLDLGEVQEIRHQNQPLPHGAYFFRVCSQAADGFQADWSDPIPFSLAPPPAAPQIAPASGQMRVGWQAVAGASGYRFQMAADAQFQELLMDQQVPEASLSFPMPELPRTYHVRIAVLDDRQQSGDFSPPQQFDVKAGAKNWLGLGAMALVFGLVIAL